MHFQMLWVSIFQKRLNVLTWRSKVIKECGTPFKNLIPYTHIVTY